MRLVLVVRLICGSQSHLVDIGMRRAGVVVLTDEDVGGGHGGSNLVDHIAGVAAGVLQVRLPANITVTPGSTDSLTD